MVWYDEEQKSGKMFNFRDEIKQYCKKDVTILRLACIAFRKVFISESGIDPFFRCTTIASSCMLTYRKHFLQPDTIGIVPLGGYRLADNQSAVASQWLRWKVRGTDKPIIHAGNGREARICGYKVINYTVEYGLFLFSIVFFYSI